MPCLWLQQNPPKLTVPTPALNNAELSAAERSTLPAPHLYLVKAMSILDALKIFSDTSSANVTCPKCFKVSPQSRQKLNKNITMICPHCGHYFRKNED
ncbi:MULTISPECIES: YnfU family zinc-binding protein [unclassified Serratia]|uniref:YnfU family zinc-binding protein n=2 Tax=unclassified Serratia (in: enterobacteria) TaxID=2647522 RepID=UPI000907B99F